MYSMTKYKRSCRWGETNTIHRVASGNGQNRREASKRRRQVLKGEGLMKTEGSKRRGVTDKWHGKRPEDGEEREVIGLSSSAPNRPSAERRRQLQFKT